MQFKTIFNRAQKFKSFMYDVRFGGLRAVMWGLAYLHISGLPALGKYLLMIFQMNAIITN